MDLKRFVGRGFGKYSIAGLAEGTPGKTVLMSCNKAIARAAIEEGVKVAASYPGSPLAYVVKNLVTVANLNGGIYAEWSSNEKQAFEVATSLRHDTSYCSLCLSK